MSERTCSVDGCNGKHHGRGLCSMHHMRVRRSGTTDITVGRPPCKVDECNRSNHAKGYCTMHYRRFVKTGSPDGLLRAPNGSGTVSSEGYRWIYAPTHALARTKRQILEHRVVLYDSIGGGDHPCHWCGVIVSWDLSYPADPLALIVDHVDEDKLNNDETNLVPSCNACNIRRSNGCLLVPACGAVA